MIDFLTQISVMQKKNKLQDWPALRCTDFMSYLKPFLHQQSELKNKCSIKMRWAPEGIYLNAAEIRLDAEL